MAQSKGAFNVDATAKVDLHLTAMVWLAKDGGAVDDCRSQGKCCDWLGKFDQVVFVHGVTRQGKMISDGAD
jgi:hypothetical protein